MGERGEKSNKEKAPGKKLDNLTKLMVNEESKQGANKKNKGGSNFYENNKKGKFNKGQGGGDDDADAAAGGASKRKPNKHNKGGDDEDEEDDGIVCKTCGMCFNTAKQLEQHYKKSPGCAPHDARDDVPPCLYDECPPKGKVKQKRHGHRGF